MILAVKDISKLLADITNGAWVALSNDEDRVVAYSSDLDEALKVAAERGEANPVITRVPENGADSIII